MVLSQQEAPETKCEEKLHASRKVTYFCMKHQPFECFYRIIMPLRRRSGATKNTLTFMFEQRKSNLSLKRRIREHSCTKHTSDVLLIQIVNHI